MGHSSITVTLDRYGHLFPELDEATAWRSTRADGGGASVALSDH